MVDQDKYMALVGELDDGDFDVDSFEASMLETILRMKYVSVKQAIIIDNMVKKYLEG